MKGLGLIAVLILLSSCSYFENKKIQDVVDESHEMVQDKLEELDTNAVDRYPVFKECESLTGAVETEKQCFVTTLSKHLTESFQDVTLTQKMLSEEVLVYVKVPKEGGVIVEKVKMSSEFRSQLPQLELQLEESLKQLPEVKPAIKFLPSETKDSKGDAVQVTTHFLIPIKVKVQ